MFQTVNFVFSSKSMEVNVGQDTFSKFDYQKFSNGSQSFRTTYLGPLVSLKVKTGLWEDILCCLFVAEITLYRGLVDTMYYPPALSF